MNDSIASLMNSLKSGAVEPVYLFQGNDKYLQKLLSEKIADKFFDSSKQNKNLLIPDDIKGEEIIEQITATDLFSSKKMFVLLDPQKLKGNVRKEFLAYCDNPIPSNCLIIVLEEFSGRVAMVRELTKRYKSVNVSPPFEWDMKKWVKYLLRENGIESKPTIINKIIELAGDSVGHVANEIEKITILLEDGQKLTEELVEQFSGWKREHQRWEFLNALGRKDLDTSLRTGLSILNQNEDMFSLIYPLTTFFQELLFARISPKTPPKRGYMPLPGSVIKNLPNYIRNYSRDEIELALNLLSEIDLRSKTTAISHESEMTKFLFNLIGKNER
jgi:DNA polymerase-3 subunit delta